MLTTSLFSLNLIISLSQPSKKKGWVGVYTKIIFQNCTTSNTSRTVQNMYGARKITIYCDKFYNTSEQIVILSYEFAYIFSISYQNLPKLIFQYLLKVLIKIFNMFFVQSIVN